MNTTISCAVDSNLPFLLGKDTGSSLCIRSHRGHRSIASIHIAKNIPRLKRGDPIFMLVGNKCDKAYAREVSEEDGAALARQFGCEFIETSAKTAVNVEILFKNIVRALRQRRVELDAGPRRNLRRSGTATRPRPQCIIL